MGSPGNSITPTHWGPAVDITVWLCFTLTALCIVSKIYTKLSRGKTSTTIRIVELDDILLVLALLFSLAYSVAISQQVRVGFGEPIDQIEPSHMVVYEKLNYVSHFMYLCALCVANAAGILFGMMLEPSVAPRRVLRFLLALNGLWTIASLLGVAFQCQLPYPWQSLQGKCYNQAAFWTFVELVNVVINVSLSLTLGMIICILKMRNTKFLLMLLFMLRDLVILPVTFKIKYLVWHAKGSTRLLSPSEGYDVTICSTLILTITIVATCLPFMKTIMEQLQPGWSTGKVRVGVSAEGHDKGIESDTSGVLATRNFQIGSASRGPESA